MVAARSVNGPKPCAILLDDKDLVGLVPACWHGRRRKGACPSRERLRRKSLSDIE
jgi:hypothetical protein